MGKFRDKFSGGEEVDFLIVGLGNPGSKYADTRHNVGAKVVEEFARASRLSLTKTRQSAEIARYNTATGRSVLAVPTTFMNESGLALGQLSSKFKVASADRVIIVHDELDLPCGVVKLKVGGGLAGHNGLKSIKQHLKTDEFSRLRIGIDRPRSGSGVSDYVLRPPTSTQAAAVSDSITLAMQALDKVIDLADVDRAMATVNASK